MKGRMLAWFILIVVMILPAAAEARVVRFVVEKTRPFADGKPFGSSGPYVRLEGTVLLEVDPSDPLNALIVNLDKAAHNAKGRVEFRTRFVIIKPSDMARGNRKIVYGINNRGNPIELRFHQFPEVGDGPEGGDGLLFRLGYTYVDAGWAGDVDSSDTRLGAELPVAVQAGGRPIVAPIRVEYEEADLGEYTVALKGNTRFRSYETADTDSSRSVLTVRDSIGGEKKKIASNRWAFGRCPTGQASLMPTTLDLCVFDGFQKPRIYELIYPAKNPWVMGLGYAVTRDVASFLRNAVRDDAGNANPLAQSSGTVGIRRVYATGTSSTGMYLRDFLYLGFNEDESHRKVFDAVRIMIPGTHRLFANVEFADPDSYSRQDEKPDFLSYSHPPLTFAVTTDPVTGVRDGILKRPTTDPLVMQIDSANEFWQMNASLNVHDGRGQPVPIPDNVRLYSLAGHSHGGGSGVASLPAAKGICEYPINGASSYNTVARALLVALDEWADRGIAPPPSRYADVRDGTLVTVEEAARAFPKIPGVKFPTVVNGLWVMDRGPQFGLTGGWLTKLPPARGASYRVLVPKPDRDGIDVGGIRTVDVTAAVGTNTGWNLIAAGPRGTDLCGLSGAFFPFAKTAADRLASGDPRLSLAERYRDHAGFVKAVDDASRALVKERFLLQEDADRHVETAKASSILK
jgi:hypothetical protein